MISASIGNARYKSEKNHVPCCRIFGLFMRASPIVGGNGNSLKLKTTAKLNNNKNFDRHGLRPIYATFPTLVFLTAGYTFQ
jgi:hypothetical protein